MKTIAELKEKVREITDQINKVAHARRFVEQARDTIIDLRVDGIISKDEGEEDMLSQLFERLDNLQASLEEKASDIEG